MRLVLSLALAFILFSAWETAHRERTEHALALVAGQIAQREVDVGCPGFWTRLVEITPYAGWVAFDEHGRPNSRTELSAQTCSSLERLRKHGPPEVGCLLLPELTCPRSTLAAVGAMVTLAHESWHLRGVRDEARTQCYAVQTVELVARGFRFPPPDAATIGLYVAVDDARALRGEYHSSECRPGGAFDLHPETAAWPSA